jgi:Protein of unknown function (DUF4240)
MDLDRFWDLIEQARTSAGPAADQAVRDFDQPDDDAGRDFWDFDDLELDPEALQTDAGLAAADGADAFGGADDAAAEDDEVDGPMDDLTDPVATALVGVLAGLEPAEIAAFELIFDFLRGAADRDDIANAALLIEHGFLADDSFDDFKAGLVALGRGTFERALRDPDTLADHPLVREIAQANDPRWLGREDLHYAASRAYAEATGRDEVTFFDLVEAQDVEEPDVPEPDRVAEEWTIADEAETRRRLPRLADLFYERSMRNRERALQKLGHAG